MKAYILFQLSILACFTAIAKPRTYAGSTPAHTLIREFLQISPTDSIDFIRWKLDTDTKTFRLQCHYGLAQAGTPGFSNEKTVALKGVLTRAGNVYRLVHGERQVFLLEVNENVLHFLDRGNHLLIGNGGYSYALNSAHPVQTDGFNLRSPQTPIQSPLVFEGRTPCQDLSALLGLQKSDACNKMKWYFLLYADSVSGKPLYFLMGGMGYRKETMARGSWQILPGPGGRMIYRLQLDKWERPLHLLKGDDNILFFTDGRGHLLVGNEHFSYTLNRRKEAYAPARN